MARVVVMTDKFLTQLDQKLNALSRSIATSDESGRLIIGTNVPASAPPTDALAVVLDDIVDPDL